MNPLQQQKQNPTEDKNQNQSQCDNKDYDGLAKQMTNKQLNKCT